MGHDRAWQELHKACNTALVAIVTAARACAGSDEPTPTRADCVGEFLAEVLDARETIQTCKEALTSWNCHLERAVLDALDKGYYARVGNHLEVTLPTHWSNACFGNDCPMQDVKDDLVAKQIAKAARQARKQAKAMQAAIASDIGLR